MSPGEHSAYPPIHRIRILLWHSLKIARVERIRSKRQLGRSSVVRIAVTAIYASIAIIGGISAYRFGTAILNGQVTLPIETVHLVVTAAFLVLLIGFIQRTSTITERIDINHLLTTVSTREVVLGVTMAVSSRIGIPVILTTVSIAVGFAVGSGAPMTALTIFLAVAALFVLATLAGVCLSLAVEFLTTRSPRFRRYKNVFVVMGFTLAFGLWIAAITGLVSIALLRKWINVVPVTWFVNLALLGVPEISTELLQSGGALVVFLIGVPVLTAIATGFAERVWTTEPVSAKSLHRSRSLVGEGFAEWLFGGRVSRPVLTVARKRWLQERRVPRSLMLPGYLIVLLLGVFFPILSAGEVPGISLVILISICAAATGLAFGMPPIETEYQSLPMTLTSVTGEQFVRGTVLSGIAVGAPITVLATFILAVGSPLNITETAMVALSGVFLCFCSVTLASAIGMRVSYRDLFPAPLPLTSATVYAEIGRAGFLKMGKMLGLLGLVCLPALSGYSFAFLGSETEVLMVPMAAVRVGSLGLTVSLAIIISFFAFRRAISRYNQYTLS